MYPAARPRYNLFQPRWLWDIPDQYEYIESQTSDTPPRRLTERYRDIEAIRLFAAPLSWLSVKTVPSSQYQHLPFKGGAASSRALLPRGSGTISVRKARKEKHLLTKFRAQVGRHNGHDQVLVCTCCRQVAKRSERIPRRSAPALCAQRLSGLSRGLADAAAAPL